MPDEKKQKAKEQKRKNVVDAMNRMILFLENYNAAQHQAEVPHRLDRLEKIWDAFEIVQADCEELDEGEEMEAKSLQCRAQMEEKYFQAKAGLVSRLPPVAVPAVPPAPAEVPRAAALTNVKLPTITLPEFDGDFNGWLTFHDTFLSMIHSSTEISFVQKFHYLRASLKGEAANLIQSIAITANNYIVAWDTLVKRYSNKALLRKKHIRALLKYPKIANQSVEALHKVVDEFQRHTKILEQLGEPVEHFSSILMELLEDKLDDASLAAWEESIATENEPTFAKMIEFLQRRARILETISINRPHHNQIKPVNHSSASKRPSNPRVSTNAATEASPKSFPLCPACEKQQHSLFDCPVFNSMDPKNRLKVVAEKKLCSNCFRNDHFVRTCRSRFRCKQCSKRHHSMIHPGPYELNSTIDEENAASRSSATGTTNPGSSNVVTAVSAVPVNELPSSMAVVQSTSVLLTTVVLIVLDAYGQEHIARVLLDTGSQPNAISERLCQQLHLNRRSVNVPIAGVDGTVTSAKHEVSAEVRSRVSDFHEVLDFLVLRKVTSDTPSMPFNASELKLPDDLALADPDFGTPRRVDMIIGAAHFYSFLRNGRFRLPNLLFVETVFGWIASGKIDEFSEHSQQPTATCHAATVVPVDELLQRFWQIEEVSGSNYSVDERQCEDFYQKTVSRDPSGRYIVRMPKHPQCDQMIGESKANAMRRLQWLDKRLEKDDDLKAQYHSFMDEYISLGHMIPAPDDDENGSIRCYLPHHPVVKQSSTTTKVRVVFDGSAKTSTGHSLNDALLVGPVVQDDILDIHLRFRMVMIAVVADAEKMYRQVLMHREDRPLQKILWPPSSSGSVQAYELCTVTYGLAPSSFLATRTLLQLAEDHGSDYPKASKALRKNVYVDDFISGDNTIEGAIQLRTELTELLQKGGFRLRKWCSNSLPVLAGLPPELLGTQSSVKFGPDETIKTLGISWEPEADVFKFDTSIVVDNEAPTKRSILSAIAQLFDPLGIISPVVVQAKILMQHLWLLALEWDTEVPPDIRQQWIQFAEQLPQLSNFRIDRYAFVPEFQRMELHCFADASKAAYGACIYVRSEASDGSVKISLLASKSKVAPLKPLSIPRLELCAALIASRLYGRISTALDMSFSNVVFWSDSTVVLQWMKSPPRSWKTFVANRISEIQSSTHGSQWLHVAGKDNPADLVSRGMSAGELVTSNLWKYGPSWLQEDRSRWPVQVLRENQLPSEEMESNSNVILAAHIQPQNPLFERYSSYQRLVNVVGYCLRFAHNTRCKGNRQGDKITDEVLSADELESSKLVLVKLTQAETFRDELKLLKKGHAVAAKSPLRLLSPFVDSEGLIRVGGRLCLSEEPYNVKHQLVMPGFHPFTKLLLKYYHHKLIHGGITMTLAAVRDEFWPLNGRRAVRSVIRKCFRCKRARPQPIQQPIGQLPMSRVTAIEAFACTGVDYCGPIYLKPTHRKGPSRKAYIAIFVCFNTKAVHIELVSDLTTDAFLMALTRFVWRRNKPYHIYSDNGTNFIGAKNALHQVHTMLQPGTDLNRIKKHLAEDNIQWHLIPPRAPNFGGLWEAAVKVAKTHLVRQLGDSLLSFEELTTVLVSIEGAMNSRPLTPLSDDPNDLSALTPAHFLVRNMIRPLPEPDVRNAPLNRLNQYQKLQAYSQRFWHRWRNEYLKELQVQHKTNPKQYQLSVGDVVIVKDESLPPARWPLARILELHPGPDDVTRVATLRTPTGVLKRAVCKICPLECAEED